MMLKIDRKELARLEKAYPGIAGTIRSFEDQALPACSRCCSTDTGHVQCGIVGRTIALAAATTKFKLIANGPKPGQFFCNACNTFFE